MILSLLMTTVVPTWPFVSPNESLSEDGVNEMQDNAQRDCPKQNEDDEDTMEEHRMEAEWK